MFGWTSQDGIQYQFPYFISDTFSSTSTIVSGSSVNDVLISKCKGGSTIHVKCGHVLTLIVEEGGGDCCLDLGGATTVTVECGVEEFGEFDLDGLGGEGGGEEVEWIVVQHLVG